MAKISKPFNGDYKMTSNFGWRDLDGNGSKENFHDGIDFALPQGTPVHNIDAGKVVRATVDQYGGAFVDVVADSDGGMARYLHLSRIDVKPGQHVGTGEIIG